jgi:hypothetical protein
MPTLILSPRYTDDSVKLWRAAISQGWDVERLTGWRCPEGFDPEEPVLYGEPLFNEAVAGQLGLSVIQPPEDFLVRLPQEYVRRRVQVTNAAGARKLPGPVFLKPPNRKVFSARVYASGAELPEMPDDDSVLISEPVDWLGEFRFFIQDRRVQAWTPYLLAGALARKDDEWIVDPDLAAKARELVDRLIDDPRADLPIAFVLDVGVIQGVGAAVVEANEASGAGIYGCDPRDVLNVLRAATIVNPEK